MTEEEIDKSIVLRNPSNTCSQRMRVSKWKRYELMNTRGGPRPIEPGSLTSYTATNGMKFTLARRSK